MQLFMKSFIILLLFISLTEERNNDLHHPKDVNNNSEEITGGTNLVADEILHPPKKFDKTKLKQNTCKILPITEKFQFYFNLDYSFYEIDSNSISNIGDIPDNFYFCKNNTKITISSDNLNNCTYVCLAPSVTFLKNSGLTINGFDYQFNTFDYQFISNFELFLELMNKYTLSYGENKINIERILSSDDEDVDVNVNQNIIISLIKIPKNNIINDFPNSFESVVICIIDIENSEILTLDEYYKLKNKLSTTSFQDATTNKLNKYLKCIIVNASLVKTSFRFPPIDYNMISISSSITNTRFDILLNENDSKETIKYQISKVLHKFALISLDYDLFSLKIKIQQSKYFDNFELKFKEDFVNLKKLIASVYSEDRTCSVVMFHSYDRKLTFIKIINGRTDLITNAFSLECNFVDLVNVYMTSNELNNLMNVPVNSSLHNMIYIFNASTLLGAFDFTNILFVDKLSLTEMEKQNLLKKIVDEINYPLICFDGIYCEFYNKSIATIDVIKENQHKTSTLGEKIQKGFTSLYDNIKTSILEHGLYEGATKLIFKTIDNSIDYFTNKKLVDILFPNRIYSNIELLRKDYSNFEIFQSKTVGICKKDIEKTIDPPPESNLKRNCKLVVCVAFIIGVLFLVACTFLIFINKIYTFLLIILFLILIGSIILICCIINL